MCAGDDKNCPEFELHHRKFKETLDRERRSFLRSSFAAAGGVAAMTAGGISGDAADGGCRREEPTSQAVLSPFAGECRYGALGLFQQEAEAAGRDRFRRLHHH